MRYYERCCGLFCYYLIMKRSLKVVKIGFLILIGLIFISVGGYSIKNEILYKKVDTYAKSEYELLNLPNELKGQEEINLHSSGCSYDYKVGSTRCGTRRVKYFVVDNDPFDEYDRLNNYLLSLGWKNKYEETNVEGAERLKRAGYLPKEMYRKGELYDLELFLQFLGEKDYNQKPYFESDKKTNNLIDKYHKEGKTLYKVSITTDFVN